MFYRIHDCWNRPIGSAPDAYVDVLERTPVRGQRALELTGNRIRALNLGSYNYLGFAAHDPYCTPRAVETLRRDGWSSCSPRAEAGTTQLHVDLEGELAAFLGKPAALCFGMGFATNSAVLPALAGPGCLIVSDALNHASIVSGARGSGAKVAVFAHNDVDSLEGVLRAQVASVFRGLLGELVARGETLSDEEIGFVTSLVTDLAHMPDPQARDLIRAAFDADLVEGFFIGRDDVEKAYRQGEQFPEPFDAAAWFKDYPEEYQKHLKPLAQQERRERTRTRPAASLLTEPPPGPLPGRNAPCWCGSGNKYKACHYQQDQERSAAASASATPVGRKRRRR